MNASMDHDELRHRFATLTTAHLADACLRVQVPVRSAPASLQAVESGSRLAGRVCPTRHVGSVDIFLEALERPHLETSWWSTTPGGSMKRASAISWP